MPSYFSGQPEFKPDKNQQLQIEFNITKLMFEGLRMSIVGTIAGSIILAIILWPVIDHDVIFLWLIALALITALRSYMCWKFFQVNPASEQINFWENWFITGTIIAGIIWGLAGWALFPHGYPFYQAMLTIILAGICAGGLAGLSAHWKLLAVFQALILLPLAFRFLLEGLESQQLISLLIVIYLLILAVNSKRINQTLKENVCLSLQSQAQAKSIIESEQRFRDISEAAGEYLWEIDKNSIYTFVTEKSKEVKGYSPEELIEHSPEDFMPNEDRQRMRDILQHAFEKKISFTLEHRTILKNNLIVWELINGVPLLDEKGELVGFRGAGLSITERKESEEALIEAQHKAEQASRAKSEFLSTMSHEIRTPMNGVLGMAELLEATDLKSEQQEYVSVILNSGKLLTTIINDILDFSKLEAERVKLEEIPFNMESLICDVLQLLSMHVEEKGLELIIDYPPENPHYFIGDPDRLRQVLLNIVGNAIKFTEQGQIKVSLRSDISNNNAAITLAVEDTGIGIDPEVQEHLFESFSQADSSTTRKYGGTGLGLAICKQIVDLMKGEIKIESEPGKGAIFNIYFQLPLTDLPGNVLKENDDSQLITRHAVIEDKQDYQPQKKQSKELEFERQFQGHILLVEDILVNQKVAEAMLKKLGLTVDLAEDGQKAVDCWRTGHYDLIFMDCRMPTMDGYQATKIIRSESKDASLPIIALTANISIEDHERCQNAGMNDVVTKPFKQADLTQALIKWLPDNSKQA